MRPETTAEVMLDGNDVAKRSNAPSSAVHVGEHGSSYRRRAYSTDIRQIPGGFEARIAPLNGLGNGKSAQCGAKGDRSGPLRAPGRWHALIGRHRGMPLPLSPAAL
jgi:hypothetical protein